MLVPNYWRSQKERYRLEGSQCPVCGAAMLTKRPICPSCGASTSENIVDKKNALGVGALLFVKGEDGRLKLLLFEDVSNGPLDKDKLKQERIVGTDDRFSMPAGFNTVTGRVDQPESFDLFTAETDTTGLDPALKAILVQTMLREISEEAPGLTISTEQIPYLSLSSVIVEQIRPIEANSAQKELITFIALVVLAALLEASDLAGVERPYQLFDVEELSQLEQQQLRKATLATLDFLRPALLFLAKNGQIEENLIPVSVLNQQN